MGALKKQVYQPQEAEIIIFPFEQARPAPAKKKETYSYGFKNTEFYDILMFEVKAFGVAAILGGILFASLYGGWKSKKAVGLDVNPNVSYSAIASESSFNQL